MSTIALSIASPLRRTARSLLRHPAFTVAAVLTLALGIGAATAIFIVVSRWLTSFLFEVRTLDFPTYVTVLGVLLVAVALAAYAPARRAAKLDPVETLRAE